VEKLPTYGQHGLLFRVAAGDEGAFRDLFHYWHPLLSGYLYRVTESRELTEEILQDVFLKIWMRRDSLAEIADFKGYLVVVCRNRAFDAMRKRLRNERQRRLFESEMAAMSTSPDHDLYAGDDWSTLIDKAIDELPARRKEVYLLCRHERLSYIEIAALLGISRESVKTHLKLASRSITAFIQLRRQEILLLTGVLIFFRMHSPFFAGFNVL
jgi:RNA polymerase sigma-70 factor (family 1)